MFRDWWGCHSDNVLPRLHKPLRKENFMEYRTLGRTGLKVSVMGIGAGGPSRLGQRYNTSEADSIAIIREALDNGVNFIDTAEAYGTEDIIGKAISGYNRDSLVISTKKSTHARPTPEDIRYSLEGSLRLLRTDYVDVYHLHGVVLNDYDYLLAEIVPVLQRLQAQGHGQSRPVADNDSDEGRARNRRVELVRLD